MRAFIHSHVKIQYSIINSYCYLTENTFFSTEKENIQQVAEHQEDEY